MKTILTLCLLAISTSYAADNTQIIQAGNGWSTCVPQSDPKCQRYNEQEKRYREYDRDRERNREDQRLRDLDRDMKERTERMYERR